MGTQVDDTGTPVRARAGTLAVIGTMAVIAIVSVTAVVAWARLGRPGEPGDAETVDEIPAVLAGGNQPQPVPAEVVAAVDLPVIGAAKLDKLPGHMMDACVQDMGVSWDPGAPDVEYAFITADGVVASLIGEGTVPGGFGMGPDGEPPSGLRVRCDLRLEDGTAINRGGSGYEEIFPGQPVAGGFMSSSCCDQDGLASASAAITVPADAHWALQDRGSWLMAFEVDGLEQTAVTWRYREQRLGPGGPPTSRVIFVAEDGTVVGETTAGGQF